MAGKDYTSGTVDFGSTPVEVLLTSAGQRQTEASLPKSERKRAIRERRRAQERLSGRIGLDLPVELKGRLVALAKRESVPVSQLVAFMLIDWLPQMENTTNPLWGYLKPSKCAKYDQVIDLEKRNKERK